MNSLEVLFTPADFTRLAQQDLSDSVCVVFDVLRATSSMVMALGNGASAILPVEDISQALAVKSRQSAVLLAGERDGVRIGPDLAQGTTFDLGNSPREFTAAAVEDKTIVMTTTNGTRALHACRGARFTLAASFLNLGASAAFLRRQNDLRLLLVCSGTYEEAAYEDVLGAGALCDLLWDVRPAKNLADSARMARELFLVARENLLEAMCHSRNAQRLLSRADLRHDVAFCLQRDTQPLVAALGKDGFVRRSAPVGSN